MAVKHVVLLRFRPQIKQRTVDGIFEGVRSMRQHVPGLLDFSGGAYSSLEGLHQGFTHGFVVTFADEGSRNAYLDHPVHEKVKQMILQELDGGLEAVVAFDWVE